MSVNLLGRLDEILICLSLRMRECGNGCREGQEICVSSYRNGCLVVLILRSVRLCYRWSETRVFGFSGALALSVRLRYHIDGFGMIVLFNSEPDFLKT